MSKVDYRNIEKVKDRCGGRAVVAGTRIRVSLVVQFHQLGMTPAEIVQEYPHLRTADIYDALAYAEDHPEEIAADVAAEDEEPAKEQLARQLRQR